MLYFENSKGERREIGKPKDCENAWELIHSFCEERKYQIYYTRMWDEDNAKKFDVGSHTEFFILEDANKSEIGVD